MLITDQYMHNRSISLSVIGVPNAGKSSLINYFLGFDLSIVTHKPQTTRQRFHCVAHIDHTEIIFTDTPGVHKSNQEMNVRMNGQAYESLNSSDVNLICFDLSRDIFEQYKDLKGCLQRDLKKSWIVFTKADLVSEPEKLAQVNGIFEYLKELIPAAEKYFVISATEETNMYDLTGAILDEAQEGMHLYPGGEVSNKNERFFVTEYIREQCFLILKEELPYEIAVVIDEYKDMVSKDGEQDIAFISASIIVNRPSQRAIVVGKQGQNIKAIGTEARKKIEAMTQRKVHLNLHVKVIPKWMKNNKVLEQVGLPRVESSKRVWRAQL